MIEMEKLTHENGLVCSLICNSFHYFVNICCMYMIFVYMFLYFYFVVPPGPIENNRIVVYKNGQPTLRQASDYGQLSKDMWLFLHRIYGGGPELIIRQSVGASVKPVSSSPTPQQNPTLKGSVSSATCTSSLSSAASSSALTSSNTSAVSSHSYMQQSSVTSSEMASQTISCPTYQSNSSPYPVPLYASTVSTDACDRTVETEGCNLASQQPAIADASSVANKTNVGKEVPSVNQTPISPIKQSREVQQSKEVEVSTSTVPKQELSLPQDGQHSALSKQDKQKTLSKSMDDVSRQTSPSKPVKTHEHDAGVSKHPQQASIHQSPMKGKSSSLTSFIPVPASCSSLSQLQTNSSFTKMASVSSDQVITFSSQSEITSGCQLSDEETPSPLAREDLKTSIESLPDSGVGTDYSCSGTDLPSLPGNLAKLQSGNAHSCEYNIDSAAAVKENNPSNVQTLTVSKEAPAVVSQRKIETKAILSPVPSNTNHAKAKKKNKKGKNMDVTRV